MYTHLFIYFYIYLCIYLCIYLYTYLCIYSIYFPNFFPFVVIFPCSKVSIGNPARETLICQKWGSGAWMCWLCWCLFTVIYHANTFFSSFLLFFFPSFLHLHTVFINLNPTNFLFFSIFFRLESGSTDLFVSEYRSLLSDKLLNNLLYDTDTELATLELLKMRYPAMTEKK